MSGAAAEATLLRPGAAMIRAGSYADTATWTKGRHSFRFGAEMQRTQSYQELTGTISFTTGASGIPAVRGGAPVYSGFGANSGLHNPFSLASDAAGNGRVAQYCGQRVRRRLHLMNTLRRKYHQRRPVPFCQQPDGDDV